MDKETGQKREGIRHWYERTTKKARFTLMIATSISGSIMAIMWVFCSLPQIMHLQSFNGALTIPLVGAVWIFAFIYLFLVPSREASFRAQESLESGIDLLKREIVDRAQPAIEVWTRIGLQVEKEYPLMLQRINETIDTVRTATKNLEEGVKGNSELIKEAKPILASLKQIEESIKDDLLDDAKLVFDNLKMLSLPARPSLKPAESAPAKISEPSLSAALAGIRNKKPAEPGIAQVQVQPKT